MTQDEAWLLNEKYLGERTEDFFADCERLKAGEPLAYVIGHIPFLDTTVWLDSKPLIPRPETEYWVERIIREMPTNAPFRVLDLCAGSGCIGVSVLKAHPQVHVDFGEIDVHHHSTITANIERNDIDLSRTQIYGGNLFEHITGTYEYILTNPPYIDRSLNRTDASVLAHEPHEALFADDHGLAIIRDIIRTAPDLLTESGTLVIEHEPEQCTAIQEIAAAHNLDCAAHEDQYGIKRYTVCTRRPQQSV